MAAITSTLFSLLSSGDHIVTSPDVYGGTYGLMTNELPRFGVEVTMLHGEINQLEKGLV